MKFAIFFDIDGVLADFVGGAFRHHGKSVPMKDVRWDFPQQIGFAGTWVSEFWDGLGHDFWANLDPLADGFELLKKVEDNFGRANVGLLSSPCDTPGCAEGKRQWVKKHLPDYQKRLFLGSDKALFAAGNKILVDDHEVNVDVFARNDGRAVLVPRPWNRLRDRTDADCRFNIGDVFALIDDHVHDALSF